MGFDESPAHPVAWLVATRQDRRLSQLINIEGIKIRFVLLFLGPFHRFLELLFKDAIAVLHRT
jgi:hypothetical protein